jgi:hypothetical protein
MQSLKPLSRVVVRKVSDILTGICVERPGRIEPSVADAVACRLFEAGLLTTDVVDEKATVADLVAGNRWDARLWPPEIYGRVEQCLRHPGCGAVTSMRLLAASAYGINPLPIIEEFERSYGR